MAAPHRCDRRRLLGSSALAAGGFLLTACGNGDDATGSSPPAQRDAHASLPPSEDLMRDHGLLKRLLLVYKEAIGRIDAEEHIPPQPIHEAGQIMRSVIHDHHERLEEQHVFPQLAHPGPLGATVGVLITQHAAGRRLTGHILQATNPTSLDSAARQRLASAMAEFIRMYEPHEAREDTVVFPAFRELMTPKQFADLGEKFEQHERRRFGPDGFTTLIDRVTDLEKILNIHDLAQFTPDT